MMECVLPSSLPLVVILSEYQMVLKMASGFSQAVGCVYR